MTHNHSLLLVDGMALLFRAYYATSAYGSIRRTSAGLPTNAVYGFVQYLLDAVGTFQPTHVICCWDMGSHTFRNDLYPAYKANRSEPPEELIPQFDLVKDVVASFDVPNIGVRGFEADDCLGTLAKRYTSDLDVLILTGDQDTFQLIDKRIRVVIMKKGQGNYAVYTLERLQEEKQLRPEQIVDLKALMGDASDHYPGVRGIGEKTALKLIQQYDSVDGILHHLKHVKPSIQKKIEDNLDILSLSKTLATIRCDVPIPDESLLDRAQWNFDSQKVTEQFEALEFHRLLQRIG